MSKLLKPFKVIRTHWKKSIFFSGVAVFGGWWWNENRKEDIIRQGFCDKAKVYGERTLTSAFEKPDMVLVLINKAARDARARSHFLKNCAPILQLAGIDVREEDWNGTYDNFEALDNFFKDKKYSAVCVVGGNKTVNAYLNYTMSKQNKDMPPAAFIPVGKDSQVMTRFLPFVGSKAYVQRLCEIAFKVVQGTPTPCDIMQIENKEASSDRPPSYLYAISTFTFDKVTDISHKGYKYWYLPYAVKRIAAGVVALVTGSFDERIIGEIEAVFVERPVELEKPAEKSGGWFFWSKKPAPAPAPVEPPLPVVVKSDLDFDADALTVSANHPDKKGNFLVEVSTTKDSAMKAFAASVMKRHPTMEQSFRATDMTLTLKLIPRHSRFYIDGVPHSDFDRVVKVSIMPKAFKLFY